MTYNAFISYSHAADGALAPALQSALQKFAKPWYRRRGLHIFRDTISLSANPSLWNSIQAALDESEYLILLASPEAARSPWIAREVQYWLNHRDPTRLIILLTEGQIHWDPVDQKIDWNHTNALPCALDGTLNDEPLYVDLRWAKSAAQVSLRNPHFIDNVATIAATLFGRPKEDLIGEDVSQFRRTRHVVAATGLVLAAAVVTALLGITSTRNQKRLTASERLQRTVETLRSYAANDQFAEAAALLASRETQKFIQEVKEPTASSDLELALRFWGSLLEPHTNRLATVAPGTVSRWHDVLYLFYGEPRLAIAFGRDWIFGAPLDNQSMFAALDSSGRLAVWQLPSASILHVVDLSSYDISSLSYVEPTGTIVAEGTLQSSSAGGASPIIALIDPHKQKSAIIETTWGEQFVNKTCTAIFDREKRPSGFSFSLNDAGKPVPAAITESEAYVYRDDTTEARPEDPCRQWLVWEATTDDSNGPFETLRNFDFPALRPPAMYWRPTRHTNAQQGTECQFAKVGDDEVGTSWAQRLDEYFASDDRTIPPGMPDEPIGDTAQPSVILWEDTQEQSPENIPDPAPEREDPHTERLDTRAIGNHPASPDIVQPGIRTHELAPDSHDRDLAADTRHDPITTQEQIIEPPPPDTTDGIAPPVDIRIHRDIAVLRKGARKTVIGSRSAGAQYGEHLICAVDSKDMLTQCATINFHGDYGETYESSDCDYLIVKDHYYLGHPSFHVVRSIDAAELIDSDTPSDVDSVDASGERLVALTESGEIWLYQILPKTTEVTLSILRKQRIFVPPDRNAGEQDAATGMPDGSSDATVSDAIEFERSDLAERRVRIGAESVIVAATPEGKVAAVSMDTGDVLWTASSSLTEPIAGIALSASGRIAVVYGISEIEGYALASGLRLFRRESPWRAVTTTAEADSVNRNRSQLGRLTSLLVQDDGTIVAGGHAWEARRISPASADQISERKGAMESLTGMEPTSGRQPAAILPDARSADVIP